MCPGTLLSPVTLMVPWFWQLRQAQRKPTCEEQVCEGESQMLNKALCHPSPGFQESKASSPHALPCTCNLSCPLGSLMFPLPYSLPQKGSGHFLRWAGGHLGTTGGLDPGSCLEGPTQRFRACGPNARATWAVVNFFPHHTE